MPMTRYHTFLHYGAGYKCRDCALLSASATPRLGCEGHPPVNPEAEQEDDGVAALGLVETVIDLAADIAGGFSDTSGGGFDSGFDPGGGSGGGGGASGDW